MNMTTEEIDIALDDPDWEVRMNTERKYNPNDEWYTRFVAVRRHSITPEEIDAALNDEFY